MGELIHVDFANRTRRLCCTVSPEPLCQTVIHDDGQRCGHARASHSHKRGCQAVKAETKAGAKVLRCKCPCSGFTP